MEKVKKVKFGFKNSHAAKLTEKDNAITYETPFAIPGSVNFSADPEGDTSSFFADDEEFFSKSANNGYSGELEIADTPDEFLTDILGMEKDENGAIIENSKDKASRFAFMCEIDGDPFKNRIVFYDCLATRPSIEYSTNEEGIEVKTTKMNIKMKPRSTDNQVKATLPLTETNSAIYNKFFEKVYEKNATATV